MAFYYLNKLAKTITKNELFGEFKKYGKVKFVGDPRQDSKSPEFNSSIVEFNELSDKDGFESYCKAKNIYYKLRQDQNTSQSSAPSERAVHQSQPTQVHTQTTNTKIIVANPSFHYYKDTAYGNDIENFRFSPSFTKLFEIQDAHSFTLKTTYPGLLVGSGYNHPKLKSNKDDFQLGFFFDHTSGLPLIPGSSIKGVIRSVFPEDSDAHREAKIELLMEYGIEKNDIELLKKELFDNNATTVFYDAFIVSTANADGKIFGSDYITPHGDDGLKNPVPVKFLKILPDVSFCFQFKARDEHIKLFHKIILDLGLGAKTNVGYGKFTE
ncbi:MAG: type III-B CRISPR module RAMP protein Cmr6 [Campylobacteraceae bacterium]|jgi:CRISPR-associated protein Cmr6|nr:type III-B CRISPR module RAMP protein Cmr6 [Campylobacteraceae bacterium]